MPYIVLVVDDDESLLELFTLWLEDDERFETFGAALDGIAALELVKATCPDAIVCDIQMPRMGGLEAIPLLRAARPDAVIVAHSASFPVDARELLVMADECVTKGAFPDRLLGTLHALCSANRR